MRDALNAVLLETLPIVAIGLAALYAIYALAHLLLLPPPVRVAMAAIASATALALVLLWYGLHRVAVRPRWAHPIGAIIEGLVLVNSLLHLYWSSRPENTTNLMLLILGTAFLIVSFRWLAALIVVTLAGWGLIAAAVLRAPAWQHFGFALLASTVLAIVVQAARIRTLRRLERLRLRDEHRRKELSAALRTSEEARGQLEASKRHLERMIDAVQHTAQRFRRFTDLEGIAIHDQGRIVDANPALARMLGYELREILQMHLTGLVAPESRQHMQEKLAGAWDTPYEVIARCKDGSTFPVECTGKEVPFQERTAGVIAMRDVRERKRVEEALRQSEALYRTLADSIPGLVFTNTPVGRCDYCNQRWYDFTGLTEAQTLGFGWMSAVHPEDRRSLVQEAPDAFARGKPFDYEIRLRRVDGVYRWFLGRSSPVRDVHGNIVQWVGASMDIDDRKRMEQKLAETDRRKDEFLAVLGHELRNPLAAIRNAEQYLRLGKPQADRNEQVREIVERQTAHMTRLMDDLLDLSRISSGKIELRREPLDIVQLVHKAVDDHRSALEHRGLSLTLDIADGSVHVLGDPVRLAQVLGNILQNAAKFTDRGGHVSLTVHRASDDETVVITICDTGIGMDAAELSEVFEPFTQVQHSAGRSEGGLGLGLALAKQLVAAHGGKLSAQSGGRGRGSEFLIRLPLSVAPEAAAARRVPELAVSAQRILLIEDDVDVAKSMQFLLESTGHEVATATDGVTGITMARELRPEVVMCDIGLPAGFDGYAVARAIRGDEELRNLFLVAVTGYGQVTDQQRARAAGFDVHLTKPVDLEQMQRVLASRQLAT